MPGAATNPPSAFCWLRDDVVRTRYGRSCERWLPTEDDSAVNSPATGEEGCSGVETSESNSKEGLPESVGLLLCQRVHFLTYGA